MSVARPTFAASAAPTLLRCFSTPHQLFLHLLFLLLSPFLFFSVAIGVDAINVTICPVVQTGRTAHAQHAAFAATYWGHEVPALNVTIRFIGTYEPLSSTVRGVVGAFVLQSDGCDAVIGPGVSDNAAAMNAVVNQMWVEYGSTTTDFSNRFVYPYFNRVIPDVRANQGFFAKVIRSFDWTRVNMLCASTAYGLSVASVIAASFGASSEAFSTQCVSNGLDYNATRALIEPMLSSPSRVIFFAFSATDPIAKASFQIVRELNLTQSKIILWADSNCASGGTAWALPGAYCASYMVNSTRYGQFFAAYSQRPKTMYNGAIGALGFPASQIDFNTTKGNQQAYAADATRVALHALDAYYATTNVPTSKALDAAAAAVRAVELPDGLSGDIYLPLGDRQRTWVQVFNALPDGSVSIAAEVLPDGTTSIRNEQYVLGAWHTKDNMPYDVPPPPPDPPAYWAIGVAFGLIALLAVPVTFGVRRHLRLAARPLDGAAPFAVMFVGVKNEAEVRDLGEKNAATALAHIRAVVKDAVRRTNCFESRRIDDATVMIVAKHVESALQCAARITLQLEDTVWADMMRFDSSATVKASRRLSGGRSSGGRAGTHTSHHGPRSVRSSHRPTEHHRDGQSSAHSATSNNNNNARSTHPLINIGIHFGFGMIDHDPETEFVSYHGEVVTRGAAVADVALHRQILVSRETASAVEEGGDASLVQGKFRPFDHHGGSSNTNNNNTNSSTDHAYFVFIPDGLPESYETSVMQPPKRAAFESGGISSALATADASLARRRVAVLSVRLRELVKCAPNSDVNEMTRVLADLRDIAAEHRGTVISVTETNFFIGVNCVGPIVSQAPSRAASIALHLVASFESCSVGVAGGTALVANGVCLGGVCDLAEQMRLTAVAAGVAVAATSAAAHDLDSKFELLTIDCVNTTRYETVVPCRVYAILSEIVANDEWLYAMNKADYARVNEDAWTNVVSNNNNSSAGSKASGNSLDAILQAAVDSVQLASANYSELSSVVAVALAASTQRLRELQEQHQRTATTVSLFDAPRRRQQHQGAMK